MTRSTASRVAAGLAVATATFGGALLAAAPAAAAPDEPDSSRITAPDGLYVDVGGCTSSIYCGAQELGEASGYTGVSPESLVDLPDGTSMVYGDYAEVIDTGSVTTYLYLRNDTGSVISTESVTVHGDSHDYTDSLGWPQRDIEPGGGVYIALSGPQGALVDSFSITDRVDWAVDTQYTVSVGTDVGDAEVVWTGHPTGTFNASVENVVIEADSCAPSDDGMVTGTMSFDLRGFLSEPAKAWLPTTREALSDGAMTYSSDYAGYIGSVYGSLLSSAVSTSLSSCVCKWAGSRG